VNITKNYGFILIIIICSVALLSAVAGSTSASSAAMISTSGTVSYSSTPTPTPTPKPTATPTPTPTPTPTGYSGTNLALPFYAATLSGGNVVPGGWGWYSSSVAGGMNPIFYTDSSVEHTAGVPSIRIQSSYYNNGQGSNGWRELDDNNPNQFEWAVTTGDVVYVSVWVKSDQSTLGYAYGSINLDSPTFYFDVWDYSNGANYLGGWFLQNTFVSRSAYPYYPNNDPNILTSPCLAPTGSDWYHLTYTFTVPAVLIGQGDGHTYYSNDGHMYLVPQFHASEGWDNRFQDSQGHYLVDEETVWFADPVLYINPSR